MATIVLVHGIAQEQRAKKVLESEWLPALAGGVENSGNSALADRMGDVDIQMAYYGLKFGDPRAQGVATIDVNTEPAPDGTLELTEQLAHAWLQAAAQRADDPRDRRRAETILAAATGEIGEPMGPRATLGRPVLNALTELRWFAPFGMAVAGKFVWRALTQVTRYLTDDDIRDYAQTQVLDLIGPDTRLVIGHSLGSVVAYEALHRAYAGALPQDQQVTLMTLGSPLALRNVIYDRLRPQPPHVPAAVNRWENIAAEDDLVAAELDLTPYFPSAPGAATTPCNHIVDTGSAPHDIIHYLTKPTSGRIISETLHEQ